MYPEAAVCTTKMKVLSAVSNGITNITNPTIKVQAHQMKAQSRMNAMN
jgi:hypothetical protein